MEATIGQAAPVETNEAQTAATPEHVATPTPETEAAQGDKTQAESRSFSQSELNEIIQKEKAKAEAKAERRALKVYADKLEAMHKQPERPQEAQLDGRPQLAQFEKVEDYVEAVADWKLGQRERDNQTRQQYQQIHAKTTKAASVFAEAEAMPGFNREEFDSLPVSDVVADAILESDVAAKIMAHLTSNPNEAVRINKLSPVRQAAEIGKLEALLASAPKVSNAPAPIKPIGANSGSSDKDPSQMTDAEFAKWRQSQIKQR
jgi:hypothetical protein